MTATGAYVDCNGMTARVAAALALVVLLTARALAQDVRGTVRDSASQVPIPGVVVETLGADARMFARTVTDDHGTFVLPRAAAATVVRVLRIGFRPRDVALPAGAGQSLTLDISMAVLPRLLERVVSIANPLCPRRSDADVAFGLWQQAQAALLATIVAREADPARAKVAVAQRLRAGSRDTITEQRVRIDSGTWTNSFFASQPPADYVKWGFVIQDREGHNTFYVPDADVLLSEPFQSAYCISIANRDRARPTQVGLRFAAAKPNSPRVDIDATLWIDTAARVMRDIEFGYAGLEGGAERYRPGGYVRFNAMANGLVLVSEWSLRMVSREVDTTIVFRGAARARDIRNVQLGGTPGEWGGTERNKNQPFAVTEQVGALVRGVWKDGATYQASLGAVRIRATTLSGKPMARARLKLDSTDYTGIADSTGMLVLRDLVPGPYRVVVADSTLAVIGLQVETPVSFTAIRDSTLERTVAVGTAAEALAQLCSDIRYDGIYHLIIARVTGPTGRSLEGVKWQIWAPGSFERSEPSDATLDRASWSTSMAGVTNATGLIQPCTKFAPRKEIELRVWTDRGPYTEQSPKWVRLRLTDRATAVRVELPSR